MILIINYTIDNQGCKHWGIKKIEYEWSDHWSVPLALATVNIYWNILVDPTYNVSNVKYIVIGKFTFWKITIAQLQ